MTNSFKSQPQAPEIVLHAKDIRKSYQDVDHELVILDGIDLQVKRGEMLTIVGASGSGKSTLMHILGLLDKPSTGEVIINGKTTDKLSENQLSQIRNQHLGFVYQFHHLLPEFSALDNVAMPLIVRRMSRHKARQAAEQVLGKVGLADRMQHSPGQLSGGERQRVALARALVTNPVCVLADEPTGNLDSNTASQMFDLLKQIKATFNTAFIIVTHDPKLAQLADRKLQMERGQLLEVAA
ncbi:lipoprotein-releasing ABC transporter ATP-binding protein LolD [Brackiella oedipodis]|uniref:lipoprotein-releasing ABC transporter ATP-binding protein LolD n=1 Tax=Brackiella oedipodis TaxID=124225 RepID=UPI000AA95561|nr:lipoprotein-releasing ABC transporter ATP-binding protein LolD [Brackiella oedipodis]